MTEPTKIHGESPTHHGICPYCASAVSCVTRDGMTYARCSHRGCGARGPYCRDLVRAVEWFTGRPHPTKAPAQDAPAQDGAERCAACVRAGRVGPCIECPGSGVPYGLPATHTGGETRHWTRKPAQDDPEAVENPIRSIPTSLLIHFAESPRGGVYYPPAASRSVTVSPTEAQAEIDRRIPAC